MTAQTAIKDERQQPQWPVPVPEASASRGVEHLLVEGMLTAGFARARWPVPVPDLRLPLATVEPDQRGDPGTASGGGRRVTVVTSLQVPAPQFPTVTTPAG